MGWLYLPGSVDSSLDSNSPSPDTALFVTLSGTPTQRPFSWRGWKTRPWVTRLSGVTLSASTASRGVELWLAGLFQADSRVPISPWPVEEPDSMEQPPASGPNMLESFAKWNRDSSLWKTSQLSLLEDSTEFSETWPRSGSMRNGMCFQRQESERRTFAAGSSSWPTPRTITGGAESAERKQELGRTESGGGDLQSAAQKWPTPSATIWGGGAEAHLKRKAAMKGGARKTVTELNAFVGAWPTPTKAIADGGQSSRSGDRKGEKLLTGMAKQLTDMISTGDSRGRLDPATPKDGETTSQRAVLNPQFVCALMGLPLGWSSAAIVSDASVMESFRLWLLAHSSPWRED